MSIAGDVKVRPCRERSRVRRRCRPRLIFFFRSFDRSIDDDDDDDDDDDTQPSTSTSTWNLEKKRRQQGWYNTLKKSALTPPDAIFGPVWTFLYISMGISSVQAFKAGARGLPLVLYGAQLAVSLLSRALHFFLFLVGILLLCFSA